MEFVPAVADQPGALQGARGLGDAGQSHCQHQRQKLQGADDEDLASLGLVTLDTVTEKKQKWLWDKRVPIGGPTVFAGDGGVGKTLVMIDIAARVSKGKKFPDGSPCKQGRVLYFSTEDDAETQLKPRLKAAGADCSLITVQGAEAKKFLNLGDRDGCGLRLLKKAVTQYDGEVRLVIFDPITAFMGGKDINRDNDVREVFTPLARLSQQYGLAIINSIHFGKNTDVKVKYRSIGSVAFVNASRASWAIGREYEEDEVAHFLQIKWNYTGKVPGLMYTVRLVWDVVIKDNVPNVVKTTRR
jgi:RecA-family ATPase